MLRSITILSITMFIVVCTMSIQAQSSKSLPSTSYDLQGNSQWDDADIQSNMLLKSLSEGVIKLNLPEVKIDGKVLSFRNSIQTNSYHKKDAVTLYFKDNQKENVLLLNDKEEIDKSIDPLTNAKATFQKVEDEWLLKYEEQYKEEEVALLKTKIKEYIRNEGPQTLSKRQNIFPSDASIGDKWVVKNDNLSALLGSLGSKIKGSAEFVLKGVDRKGKEQIADIGVKLKVSMLEKNEKNPLQFTLDLQGDIKKSLQSFHEQAIQLTGTIEIKGELGNKGSLLMNFPIELMISNTVLY